MFIIVRHRVTQSNSVAHLDAMKGCGTQKKAIKDFLYIGKNVFNSLFGSVDGICLKMY